MPKIKTNKILKLITNNKLIPIQSPKNEKWINCSRTHNARKNIFISSQKLGTNPISWERAKREQLEQLNEIIKNKSGVN